MTTSTTTITALFTVVILFTASRVTEAQQPPCLSALSLCYSALNGSEPTPGCCTAMRSVVSNQLPCLCGLYNNPNLVSSINITRALELPSHCGINSNTSVCSASAPGPSPSGPSPPGIGHNGVGTISWTAMPAILMVWAITYLH